MKTSTGGDTLPIAIRPAVAGDANFLFNAWLKSHRDSAFAKDIATDRYYDNHKRIVANVLARANVTVACDPEDPEQIFGFMAWERLADEVLVVHYAYVKFPFRHLGVARRLWAHANPASEEALCTHSGKAFHELRRAGYPLAYDPYFLFRHYG